MISISKVVFFVHQEMKMQCFGGEYMGEVFDHMLKRYDSQTSKICFGCILLNRYKLFETHIK